MADQASSSITIAAAPDAVMAVIRDVEAYPAWTGSLSAATVLEPGDDGPRKVTFTLSASGMNDDYTLLYEWTTAGVSWRLAEPTKLQKSQTGSYAVTAQGASSEVTYLLTLESRLPMIGLMRRKAERMIIDTALKELKKRVESLG